MNKRDIPDDWKPKDGLTSAVTIEMGGNPAAILIGVAAILLSMMGIAWMIIRWWRF